MPVGMGRSPASPCVGEIARSRHKIIAPSSPCACPPSPPGRRPLVQRDATQPHRHTGMGLLVAVRPSQGALSRPVPSPWAAVVAGAGDVGGDGRGGCWTRPTFATSCATPALPYRTTRPPELGVNHARRRRQADARERMVGERVESLLRPAVTRPAPTRNSPPLSSAQVRGCSSLHGLPRGQSGRPLLHEQRAIAAVTGRHQRTVGRDLAPPVANATPAHPGHRHLHLGSRCRRHRPLTPPVAGGWRRRLGGPATHHPTRNTPTPTHRGWGCSSLYGALSAGYTSAGVVISEDAAAARRIAPSGTFV